VGTSVSPWFQPLPPGDEHEPTAAELAAVVDACYDEMDIVGMVWWCRLPVSKPVLKARLVSALETKMW
jgi:hypothetical protein